MHLILPQNITLMKNTYNKGGNARCERKHVSVFKIMFHGSASNVVIVWVV